jgi:hypothetical protein
MKAEPKPGRAFCWGWGSRLQYIEQAQMGLSRAVLISDPTTSTETVHNGHLDKRARVQVRRKFMIRSTMRKVVLPAFRAIGVAIAEGETIDRRGRRKV